MGVRFLFKVAAAWLAGAAMLLAGALGVLYLAGLLVWQYVTTLTTGVWVALPLKLWFFDHAQVRVPEAGPVLRFIPELPWPWLMHPEGWLPLHKVVSAVLGKLHAGLPFAVLGACLAGAGYLMVWRQKGRIAAERQRTADRLRRRDAYRAADAPVPPIEEPPAPEKAGVFRARTRRASAG